jgi:hypothetical protein
MTKQDKTISGQKFSIGLGNKTPSRYLATRLIDFLNVNSKNKNEVTLFCRKHGFIPFGSLRNWQKTFAREQSKLRELTTRAIENRLNEADLSEINKNLKGVTSQVRFMTKSELENINQVISQEEQNIDRVKQYLVLTKKHTNSMISLWEDLVSYMTSLQPLRVCDNCGQFFSPVEKTHKKQRFCSGLCKDTYHKRKKYHETIA